jgi:plasmid stabilization system protein ParE
LEDVYNHEETIREEQAAAYQAHLEAQFASLRKQIKAFTKQLSIEGG